MFNFIRWILALFLLWLSNTFVSPVNALKEVAKNKQSNTELRLNRKVLSFQLLLGIK